MKRLALISSLVSIACTSRAVANEQATETTQNVETTDSAEASDSAEVTDGALDEDSSGAYEDDSSDSAYTPDLSDDGCGDECDIWDPDACGPGRKCTAVACEVGSSSWDSNMCRDIHGDAQMGDECESTDNSSLSGNDTCAAGFLCLNIDIDTAIGHCLAFCTGSPSNPSCPEDYTCMINGDGVVPRCLPNCDPLTNEGCVGDEVCAPTYGHSFVCQWGPYPNAPYGTPCEYVNGCNVGLACIDASAVPEPGCENAIGCCSPYCDLNAPTPCPGEGQICQPFFKTAPDAYAHVGTCALPL